MGDRGHVGPREIIRLGVGMIWIAGAVYNAVWTLRHTAFLGVEGIARDASLPIYRWFFGDVVSAAPEMWTLLLIAGELALGALTLASGRWARLGMWGGALWSLWLFPMLWPYTIMMGPYAMFLMWLARGDVRWGVRRGIDEPIRAMRLPRGRGVRHA
jgi:hypothetical protein